MRTPTAGTSYSAATNQLLSAGAFIYGYDANGNQTKLGGYGLSYDYENRLTTAAQTSPQAQIAFTYDGAGQRVYKTESSGVSTIYVYDAFGQLAAEYSSAAVTTPCTTCYLSWDHLGSTRMVTDGAGNVVARHDFLAFGDEIPSGTMGGRRRGVRRTASRRSSRGRSAMTGRGWITLRRGISLRRWGGLRVPIRGMRGRICMRHRVGTGMRMWGIRRRRRWIRAGWARRETGSGTITINFGNVGGTGYSMGGPVGLPADSL